jgi:hypothetical protein
MIVIEKSALQVVGQLHNTITNGLGPTTGRRVEPAVPVGDCAGYGRRLNDAKPRPSGETGKIGGSLVQFVGCNTPGDLDHLRCVGLVWFSRTPVA